MIGRNILACFVCRQGLRGAGFAQALKASER